METQRSTSFHWTILLLAGVLLLLNELSLSLLIGEDPRLVKALPLLRILDVWAVLGMGFLVVRKGSFRDLWRESGAWNLLSLAAGLAVFLLSNRLQAGQYEWLRLLMTVGLLWQTLRVMVLLIVRKKQDLPNWRIQLRTFWGMMLVGFLLLEGVFLFVAESHGHLRTFAAINWAQRHFEVNSRGFRDPEPPARKGAKPTLLVAGDSFAAGGGVADPKDRFGDRIAAARPDLQVINVARNGADTRSELEIVKDFHLRPDKVLLSYFGNDIMGVVPEGRIEAKLPHEYSYLPQPLRFFVYHSHFLDYVCWHLPVWGSRENFLQKVKEIYEDPEIWEIHRQDLKSWVKWSEEENVELEVVIFPFMAAAGRSGFYTDKVEAFFRSEGIPVVNLQGVFAALPPEDLVANVNDGHPNAFAHKLAAEAVLDSGL